jgi:hypothetical protein
MFAGISKGRNNMNKACVLLLALAAWGCGNENSANLKNSNATQVNVGAGNKQSVNAVGSSAVQIQSGFANEQSMNLRNSSAKQSQTGIANRQSINLDGAQDVSQNQTGTGNTQRLESACGKKVTARNVTHNQAGFLNNQTMVLGGGSCDEQKQSEKTKQ